MIYQNGLIPSFSLFLLFLCFTAPGYGQRNSVSELAGQVIDKEGTAIENVQVTLLNTSFSTRTDSSCTFNFQDVPSGRYTIAAGKPGYSGTLRNIELNAETGEIVIVIEEELNQLENVTVTAQKREGHSGNSFEYYQFVL